jgi:hypothetical protein
MENGTNTKDKYIRLSDLLYAVWDRIIILIIVGVVASTIVFGIGYLKGQKVYSEEPSYMTYMELYMGPKANISSGTAYSELFLSDDTIKRVKDAENIDANISDIRSYLFAEEREATLFRLVILTPNKALTEKIAKGMSTTGLTYVTETLDSSQMKVIQYPVKPTPVKSDIPKVQSAYSAMAVKAFPAGLVQDWEAYVNTTTSVTGNIKKALFAGIVCAGLVAISLIVGAIFKRKLRYPDDIEYASDLKVILAIDDKLEGTSDLGKKLLDISEENTSFLFLGAQEGDGTTTLSHAAVNGIVALGKEGCYIKLDVESNMTYDVQKGYVIVDGGSFGKSYDSVSISKSFDATVLIIGEDSVDDVQIQRMKAELEAAGANILGIILNKAKVSRTGRKSRYYGFYYGTRK